MIIICTFSYIPKKIFLVFVIININATILFLIDTIFLLQSFNVDTIYIHTFQFFYYIIILQLIILVITTIFIVHSALYNFVIMILFLI